MSDVKLVKKWVAADGSEHDTKQAAEQNERYNSAHSIISSTDDASEAIRGLLQAGLLSLKVKHERKPRVAKVAVVAEKPVKAAKVVAA